MFDFYIKTISIFEQNKVNDNVMILKTDIFINIKPSFSVYKKLIEVL